jgi:hypothetical protein
MYQLVKLKQSHEVVTGRQLVLIGLLLYNRGSKQRHALPSSIFPSSGPLETKPGWQGLFPPGKNSVRLERVVSGLLLGSVAGHPGAGGDFME